MIKTTTKPTATRDRRGERLPSLLCVDAMDDVALGEAEVGVCENVVGLGGVAVAWGASDVAWGTLCSTA
jgi:hypothetical protein